MIGRLCGDVIEKHPPYLLLDVQGVGYELEAPMSTFYELPDSGKSVVLYTHLLVREDAQTLYAFKHLQDRALFRDLLKVNGVGAKIALAILSGMDVRAFTQCIDRSDADALMRLPGIGRRTAERLIVEMRDRLAQITDVPDAGKDAPVADRPGSVVQDAVSALVALGYGLNDARRMVGELDTQSQSSEELIRLALKTRLS
ncbi:MAG: Holliday junction branch migration protein RuvA [Gammaproteobacteria bacterium]|nr:Holliday junction branch migration protein RuvA [Gammaproteobacteria bacterium]